MRRNLEHSPPAIIIEIWQIVGGCRNGDTPFIKEDMKLWSNVARLRIQYEGNGAGEFVRETKVDGAS